MDKNKIAVQLYSVRDDMQADFFGTLEEVKKMGYSGVEFAGLYGNDPKLIKEKCEQLGLVCLSAHVPLSDILADMDAVVECYKTLGCKYVVIPYLTEEYRPGSEKFGLLLNTIHQFGKLLRENGMVLQYHNHDFEFEKINGEYALDLLYKEVGPELLQTQLDTCWVNVGGENPAKYIEKYSGRTPTVHLKDFAGKKSDNMYALIGLDEDKSKESSGEFQFRPLGKGLNDFVSIINAADKAGAEWYIVEQDSPSLNKTPLECIEISINYLLNEIKL
ncbi:MAG: sugar phosphate isomerase/epimerase [Clostridia bacterium]|nr:sugar phosphate isomerase/epimerase [Clostridia bacterium]